MPVWHNLRRNGVIKACRFFADKRARTAFAFHPIQTVWCRDQVTGNLGNGIQSMAMISEKTCQNCGRRIEWRRKWAAVWDEVKYCSDACRKQKGGGQVDRDLETAILDLLAQRQAGKTICPSEAAKRVFPDDWNTQMERTRQAARRLVAAGRIVIMQGGRIVDPSHACGPIRLAMLRQNLDASSS